VEVDNTPADIRGAEINDIFFEMATKKGENPSKNKNTLNIIVDWKTDEKTDGWLEWGKDKHYGHMVSASADFEDGETKHHAIIKNIPAKNKNTYHFRVKVRDQAGNISYGEDKKVSTKNVIGFSNPSGDIVINEFMANPAGEDGAKKPRGEWIELYNRGDATITLNDWFLADEGWSSNNYNRSRHVLKITSQNTNTGKITIAPKEHLVVYVNRGRKSVRGEFGLNNGGDRIMLINKKTRCVKYHYYHGIKYCSWYKTFYYLKDSYSYKGKDVVEGKSIARFPDGGGYWIDPKATPGKDNQLTSTELKKFRKSALKKCFKDGKIKKTKDKLCNSDFLIYLGLLKKENGKKLYKKYQINNGKKLQKKLNKDKKNIPTEIIKSETKSGIDNVKKRNVENKSSENKRAVKKKKETVDDNIIKNKKQGDNGNKNDNKIFKNKNLNSEKKSENNIKIDKTEK